MASGFGLEGLGFIVFRGKQLSGHLVLTTDRGHSRALVKSFMMKGSQGQGVRSESQETYQAGVRKHEGRELGGGWVGGWGGGGWVGGFRVRVPGIGQNVSFHISRLSPPILPDSTPFFPTLALLLPDSDPSDSDFWFPTLPTPGHSNMNSRISWS